MTRRAEKPAAGSTSMRRVALASAVGTTIEFYDFFIYGTAAALVFPRVFFPGLGASSATVVSLATLGVAFVARPLGAIVCGHIGDRYGRKNTLVTTLILMGAATVAIGLLPTAESVGILAPILLTILRFAQGIAVGGEWAGATLLTAEYAPENRRGFYAVFPQLGPAFGLILASSTFLLVDAVSGSSGPTFLTIGWRVPFLASAVLVLVGLWVRLAIAETPEFRRLEARAASATGQQRRPLRDVLATQWREVLLGGGLMTVLFALFYVSTTYMTSFGTSADGAGLSRAEVLTWGIVAGVVLAITTTLSGGWSDRVGRRRAIITAYVATVPAAVILFVWLGADPPAAFALTLAVSLGLYGIAYGPAGAFLPELFRTEHRYSGAGLAYNLGGIIGGAVVPLLAASLAASFGVTAVGVLLAVAGLLSLASVVLLRETVVRARPTVERSDETDLVA